jgi:hypothetical protein
MKQKYILTSNVVVIAHGGRKYIRIIVRGFSPEGNKDLYTYVRCTLHCLLKIFKKTQINQQIKRAALLTFKYTLLYCVQACICLNIFTSFLISS